MDIHHAKVETILIANQKGTFRTKRMEFVELQFGGIPGDRHFGMTRSADSRQPMYQKGEEILNRRQISILSSEECNRIAKEMGLNEIKPEWLGANLLLSGYDSLTSLPPGSRILFSSGAALVCENENLPCNLPGEEIQKEFPDKEGVAKAFVKAAFKKRGIVCSVEKPGIVNLGEIVKIFVNDPEKPMQ